MEGDVTVYCNLYIYDPASCWLSHLSAPPSASSNGRICGRQTVRAVGQPKRLMSNNRKVPASIGPRFHAQHDY